MLVSLAGLNSFAYCVPWVNVPGMHFLVISGAFDASHTVLGSRREHVSTLEFHGEYPSGASRALLLALNVRGEIKNKNLTQKCNRNARRASTRRSSP